MPLPVCPEGARASSRHGQRDLEWPKPRVAWPSLTGAGHLVHDMTGTASEGLPFPTPSAGAKGSQVVRDFALRGKSGAGCPLAPRALGPAGVLGLQVRGTLPGTQAPGTAGAGRAGAAEDPASPGARRPRRVRAPSAGAGGPMVSAGGGAGAPGGRVGTGRTPGPAAPRRERRPRGRPRRRRRRAAPAGRQRSRRGAGVGVGGGGDGARGRGAAVSRYRPQRPLTRAPPLSPPPARRRARPAPRQSARAPRPALGWVCARGQWAARGGRAASGAGAERRGPIAAVLLKLKILHYANRGGAPARGGSGPSRIKGRARAGRSTGQVLCARWVPARPRRAERARTGTEGARPPAGRHRKRHAGAARGPTAR